MKLVQYPPSYFSGSISQGEQRQGVLALLLQRRLLLLVGARRWRERGWPSSACWRGGREAKDRRRLNGDPSRSAIARIYCMSVYVPYFLRRWMEPWSERSLFDDFQRTQSHCQGYKKRRTNTSWATFSTASCRISFSAQTLAYLKWRNMIHCIFFIKLKKWLDVL